MNNIMVSWPNINLIADSLGWAVIHSIWQGIIAAGIIYAVRNLTRERASELRYFTGIVTLCALLCTFVGTFVFYYQAGALNNPAFGTTPFGATPGTEAAAPILLGVGGAVSSDNPLMHLQNYTGLIGLFWIICFAVLGVRYLTAFRLTHKLRKHGLSALPSNWQACFKALVGTSGVSPKVRAYFSEHVSSPITFGFIKPVVLLPTWFFTGLTPEQCEAVILHELAHIRRHDYLTNILQIIIKTVFFYHPAVQFICKGLDTDREHACDDFAVKLTKNPEGLATALGTIRLRAAKKGGVFALSASGAADGKDAPLMHRLKRLMGTPNKSLQKNTSRGIAATAMMGSALALVITLGATASQAHPHKQTDVKTPDWNELAGAAPEPQKWDGNIQEKITVNGETYNSTAFSVTNKGGEYYIINGKKYPSKYRYSVYTKDGVAYVVKEKNGKRYIEIGDNWHKITVESGGKDHGHKHVKINGKWHNLNEGDAPWTESRIDKKTHEAVADALERAADQREAALERAAELSEAAVERRLERKLERKYTSMERKIELKERDLERAEQRRERDIARIERKIRDKEIEFGNRTNLSAGEIGRVQGEIGRLQGEIGRLHGQTGYDQGELGRMQGELGRLHGKLGRIQGERGHDSQKKYYEMRDKLIPELIADGFMNSKKSKVTMEMTPSDILINGKPLNNKLEGKYCDILSKYGMRKGGNKRIVMQPNLLSVSIDDNTQISFGTFEHEEN